MAISMPFPLRNALRSFSSASDSSAPSVNSMTMPAHWSVFTFEMNSFLSCALSICPGMLLINTFLPLNISGFDATISTMLNSVSFSTSYSLFSLSALSRSSGGDILIGTSILISASYANMLPSRALTIGWK